MNTQHLQTPDTAVWHHTHVDSLHPEQHAVLHTHVKQGSNVWVTQPLLHKLIKDATWNTYRYMYACSSLQYETIIKHICMVQTWWGWFLPAEEAVHAVLSPTGQKIKYQKHSQCKSYRRLLKQTRHGRKWKTNEKGDERGTTYGREESATQQEGGEGNKKIESERVNERGESKWEREREKVRGRESERRERGGVEEMREW